MSGSKVKRIDARALKAQLHDGGELAPLDAREELPSGQRHLLRASCVPLSRLELLVDDLVPRRGAGAVWCDDGEGLAARAAERMSALDYQDVAWLDGGIAAWEAAGFRIYSGVHVPSKAFAEVVEHEAGHTLDIGRRASGFDRTQGQVRAELERAGAPCGPHDMQIGGHARSEGLIVVTNNMREFTRMPGIRVENWV